MIKIKIHKSPSKAGRFVVMFSRVNKEVIGIHRACDKCCRDDNGVSDLKSIDPTIRICGRKSLTYSFTCLFKSLVLQYERGFPVRSLA